MNVFQNLKTGVKLILGFGILALTIVVVAATGYYYLYTSNHNLMTSYNDNLLPTEYSNSMDEAYLIIRGDTYKYLYMTEAAKRADIRQEIATYKEQFNKSLAQYSGTVNNQDESNALNKVRQTWADYQKAVDNILAQTDAGNQTAAIYQSMDTGEYHLARLAIHEAVDTITATNISSSQALNQASEMQFNQAAIFFFVISITGLLLAISGGFFIGRSIVNPLSRVAEVAQGIASGQMALSSKVDVHTYEEVGAVAAAFNRMTDRLRDIMEQERQQKEYLQQSIDDYSNLMAQVSTGDLAVRINLHSNGHGENDPLFVLGRNLNEMISNLARMIGQIREASNNLTTASAEILAATTQQASGSSEQSASIAQTTTTVDEVKAIGEQAVMRTQEVVEASNRTIEISRSGQQMVQDTIASMTQIKERVEGIAENILALSEQTQQIGEIIATVSEIAAQSNMLALNASVEAARAGENGKGFAVVAGEVRSLAEQSRQATAQVKAILQDIQKATNATVMATEEGTKVVDQGVRLTARTQEAIEQLSSVINESAQRAAQVTAGGRQQAAGVDQIAMAMQNINQAMVQSLASTRQAERAAQDLNLLAQNLNEMVKKYTV